MTCHKYSNTLPLVKLSSSVLSNQSRKYSYSCFGRARIWLLDTANCEQHGVASISGTEELSPPKSSIQEAAIACSWGLCSSPSSYGPRNGRTSAGQPGLCRHRRLA